MMKFLVDVNLPKYFSLWNNGEYIFQIDLNPKDSDLIIWNYAKENNLTIITKDSDFSNKILITEPPPKIIHIKVGNIKLKELYNLLNKNWTSILDLNKNYKLVSVYQDRIEGFN